ncbi:hypothetical protein Plano_1671 [Planococcus sp. PAMC 21323]|uniref:hypothetical protein n=1 Tax=Planococcus sp. PAMC 21323 TaxID=1526927 RepID=UPI00058643EE|nr:hypothetical protein [Planococcus sp. PAMC 21323]AIY05636.1 hypothetical protein Plano_1671 [Planococcus sp. PAMC 21323]
MSILLGMVSLAMICAFVLIFASCSISEYNKNHTTVKKEKLSEDCYAYLFKVYD